MRKKEKRKYIFILAFAVGVTIFIGFTLSKFYRDIQERVYDKQIEAMKMLSMQGSAVVEKNLEGLMNTLYGLSEYLEEDDIFNSGNIVRLRNFLEREDVGFQRIGIVDAQGNAKATSGEELNISDGKYFQTCMQEKRGTTEILQSRLSDQLVCIVAVPVLKENQESVGVLYGVIETAVFHIYNNTILEDSEQYIQIVDLDGHYIMQEASNLIGRRTNIFDGIGSVDSQISAAEIKEKIRREEQVYTEITDGNSHEIVYFTPLKLNDWCVVTVIDYSEVTDSVDYILDNDVYLMMLKTIAVIVLLCLLILYYSRRDRKQIGEFNERLMLDEKIVRIAAEKSGILIVSYGIKSGELRFINNSLLDIEFPEQVENAPEALKQYLPDDKELHEQVDRIFDSMQRDTGKREFTIAFKKNGKMLYIRIQLMTPADQNGENRQCIGVIEDVTEEQRIRDEADRDALTGLYNRRRAMEKIENYLENSRLNPGIVHACIIMDIDNFKTLNDTLGHQMGDKALQDVAGILVQHFRSYDVVCRLGGDEFLVFLKDIPEEVVEQNLASLLKKLTLIYGKDGKSVRITVSAGAALISDLNMEFKEMYRRADEVLYQIKRETKNNFKIYGKEYSDEFRRT